MLTTYCKKLTFIVINLCGVMSVSQAAELDSSQLKQTLQAQYRSLESSLQSNQFHAPIYVGSQYKEQSASGEVYAVLNYEFNQITANLKSSSNWCDLFLLHVNVKGCVIDNAGENNKPKQQTQAGDLVTVYVGREYYQPVDDAYSMQYEFTAPWQQQDYFEIQMVAKDGPVGTSDYVLTFEAIPLTQLSTFMHLKYAYRYGVLAKIMLNGYLATLGRHKVGFTVKEYDEQHHPVYIKGIEGIVERNSMRYFLAIQAYLDTAKHADTDWKSRILHWYYLAKPFRTQLIEYDDEKYLKSKMKQFDIPFSSD